LSVDEFGAERELLVQLLNNIVLVHVFEIQLLEVIPHFVLVPFIGFIVVLRFLKLAFA
jgi:hypothetical protein